MLSPDHMLLNPTSSDSHCDDRFGLTDSSELLVPRWDIILAVLSDVPESFNAVFEKIETPSVIFNHSSTDSGFLRELVRQHVNEQQFMTTIRPKLYRLALEMPTLFPAGSLPALTKTAPRQTYSRRQIACLVVHQFLCTPTTPTWILSDGSPDLHIWYTSAQRHEGAVHAYLSALFHYFERISSASSSIIIHSDGDWPISFSLASSEHSKLRTEARTPFTSIIILDPSAALDVLLGVPDGASVVFANKHIGFGNTGTQEETWVGSSPEAYVVALICPPLANDEVLVVEGAEAMVTTVGYGRAARIGEKLLPDHTFESCGTSKWRRWIMLFMDALELDTFDRENDEVLDFLPGHIDHELDKAFTAFSSGGEVPYREVVTGLWGCGAFGGNPEVKTIIQWCSASLAGVPLRFIYEPERDEFLRRMNDFVEKALRNAWSVEDVSSILRDLSPNGSNAARAFEAIYQALDRSPKSSELG